MNHGFRTLFSLYFRNDATTSHATHNCAKTEALLVNHLDRPRWPFPSRHRWTRRWAYPWTHSLQRPPVHLLRGAALSFLGILHHLHKIAHERWIHHWRLRRWRISERHVQSFKFTEFAEGGDVPRCIQGSGLGADPFVLFLSFCAIA